MNRTAEVNRMTGETEIALRLRLDGTGQGERRTGVGFQCFMRRSSGRRAVSRCRLWGWRPPRQAMA